jgi:hypothetical protein
MRSLRLSPVISVFVIAMCFCSEARGNGLLYTFSGANGLSGSFTLAIDTPSNTNCEFLGCGYTFASPLNFLSGRYGEYSFSGIVQLNIFDLPSSYDGFCCQDSWIVRAPGNPMLPLTGNDVGGRRVVLLNMFIYASLGSGSLFSGAPLTPPHSSDFQYVVGFSNGSNEFGALNTLTLVPEPPSVALLAFGVIGLLIASKYLRARSPGF